MELPAYNPVTGLSYSWEDGFEIAVGSTPTERSSSPRTQPA
jgi:hypothetical protein